MNSLKVKSLDAAALTKLKTLDAGAIAAHVERQSEAYHRLHQCAEPGCSTRIHPKFTYCGWHADTRAKGGEHERDTARRRTRTQ